MCRNRTGELGMLLIDNTRKHQHCLWGPSRTAAVWGVLRLYSCSYAEVAWSGHDGRLKTR